MFKLVILKFASDEIDNWFFVSVEIETIHNGLGHGHTTSERSHSLSLYSENNTECTYEVSTIRRMELACTPLSGGQRSPYIHGQQVSSNGMSRLSMHTKQLNLKLFKTRRLRCIFSSLILFVSFPARVRACCGFCLTVLALLTLAVLVCVDCVLCAFSLHIFIYNSISGI